MASTRQRRALAAAGSPGEGSVAVVMRGLSALPGGRTNEEFPPGL